MPRAIGDPDELDRFAYSLAHFITALNEATDRLNQSFAALGDTWQDEKRTRFEGEYQQLQQQLSTFCSNADDQVPYIRALASRLRDYLES